VTPDWSKRRTAMPGVASSMVDVGCLASALLVSQRLLLGVQS